MRVLIIKMSSMGDVIHTLPALTDAKGAMKNITFDWVVEENFKEIPAWHPNVNKIIPIALRRWRKNFFSAKNFSEWKNFLKTLRENHYDLIIDAQGLFKSAFVSLFAKGKSVGLDFHSAREPAASLFYRQKHAIDKKQHAITRTRQLFAKALGYALPTSLPNYGIDRQQLMDKNQEDYLVFLHGTTWPTKHWPENNWLALARLAQQQNQKIKLTWGNDIEKIRAEKIASQCDNVEVLPKLNLQSVAKVLAGAKAIVAVDTGLGHLAAALEVPTISLYGPTNPILTGAMGASQIHLATTFACAPCLSRDCILTDKENYAVMPPCFSEITPEKVWETFQKIFNH